MKNSKRLINGLYILFSGSFILASIIGLILIIGMIGVVFCDDEEVHESYVEYQKTKETDSLTYKSRLDVIKEELNDISAGMKDGYESAEKKEQEIERRDSMAMKGSNYHDSIAISKNHKIVAREAGVKTGREIAKIVTNKFNLTSSKEIREEDSAYKKNMNRVEIIFIYLLIFLGIRECKRIFEKLNMLVRKNQWFCYSIYKSLLRLTYIGIVFLVFKISIVVCDMFFINTPLEITGFTLDFIDYIEMIFNIAILFIIAAVYKVGLDMHQEQELTI